MFRSFVAVTEVVSAVMMSVLRSLQRKRRSVSVYMCCLLYINVLDCRKNNVCNRKG